MPRLKLGVLASCLNYSDRVKCQKEAVFICVFWLVPNIAKGDELSSYQGNHGFVPKLGMGPSAMRSSKFLHADTPALFLTFFPGSFALIIQMPSLLKL